MKPEQKKEFMQKFAKMQQNTFGNNNSVVVDVDNIGGAGLNGQRGENSITINNNSEIYRKSLKDGMTNI